MDPAAAKKVEYETQMFVENFIVQIKRRMEEAGFTLNQVARRLGWTPDLLLGVLEGHERELTLRDLADLAYAVNARCNINLLRAAMPEPQPVATTGNTGASTFGGVPQRKRK